MHESATCSAQRERWANDQWESDVLCKFFSLQKRVSRLCRGDGNTQFNHPFAEFFPILRFFNCFNIYSNQSYVVLFPYSEILSFLGQTESSLPTHRWQYCINVIFFQDCLNAFNGQ